MKLTLTNGMTIFIREEDYLELNVGQQEISYVRPNGTRAIIKFQPISSIPKNNSERTVAEAFTRSNQSTKSETRRTDSKLKWRQEKNRQLKENESHLRNESKDKITSSPIGSHESIKAIPNSSSSFSKCSQPILEEDEEEEEEVQEIRKNSPIYQQMNRKKTYKNSGILRIEEFIEAGNLCNSNPNDNSQSVESDYGSSGSSTFKREYPAKSKDESNQDLFKGKEPTKVKTGGDSIFVGECPVKSKVESHEDLLKTQHPVKIKPESSPSLLLGGHDSLKAKFGSSGLFGEVNSGLFGKVQPMKSKAESSPNLFGT